MAKQDVAHTRHFDLVQQALTSNGLLLGSTDVDGNPNIMTIGWGVMGTVWGVPMWTVLVRPSRYTWKCIEHCGCFTVNVPTAGMKEVCVLCGTKSGRDMDKIAACGLTVEDGGTVNAPVIAECPMVYECAVVHFNDVIPANLNEEIRASAYPSGDFHRVYFGKILATRAQHDAGDLLRG